MGILGEIYEKLSNYTEADRSWKLTEMTLENLSPDLNSAIWAVTIPKWFTIETIEFLVPSLETSAFEIFNELKNLHTMFEPWTDLGWNMNGVTRKEFILHYPDDAFLTCYDKTVEYLKQDSENGIHSFASRKYSHMKRFGDAN